MNFSFEFAFNFEKRLLAFVQTDQFVKDSLADLLGVNTACGFVCNVCHQSPGDFVAYQCVECDEFDMCQGCKDGATAFPNSTHNSTHKLMPIDIRFPQVIHGPEVLGLERFIFGAHTTSITQEELNQYGIKEDQNPFPLLLKQMMPFRQSPQFQSLQMERIAHLIKAATGVTDIPWHLLPTAAEHIIFDQCIANELNAPSFQADIDAILRNESLGAPQERIRMVETRLCEKESQVCQRKGFALGFAGLVQLKAIALLHYELAYTLYHPQVEGAGIKSGLAKAAIREAIGRTFFQENELADSH